MGAAMFVTYSVCLSSGVYLISSSSMLTLNKKWAEIALKEYEVILFIAKKGNGVSS